MPTVSLSWVDPSTDEPQQRVFPLPLTLGRAPGSGLLLDSGLVSGAHAVLRMEPQGLVLEDLRSRNGTLVNGARVQRAAVAPGDAIAIGPYVLVVRLEARDVRVRVDWTDPRTQSPRTVVHRLPLAIGQDPSCEIVVADPRVLARQVVVESVGDEVIATDLSGAATITLQGSSVSRGALAAGAVVQLGPWRLVLTVDSAERRRAVGEATVMLSDAQVETARESAPISAPDPSSPGDWPPPSFRARNVSVAALASTGLPMYTADFATVGAGLGGFIWVDNVLIRGVDPSRVVALGTDPCPYARYRRLCRNSQIPDHERLRSNSEATPDNLWGWPGYAAREIAADVASGRIVPAAKRFWQIFGEPALTETYTPRASDVFRGLDREAARIGWARIMRYGRVRAVRLTDDGRYVVAFSQAPSPGQPTHAFLVARYLHLAVGYPALQFLPDLQKYREETGDFVSVVNAYEDHDHVYKHLEQHGGLVLVRGRGIVASRILQRLHEARAVNANIGVVHVLRTPLVRGHRYKRATRAVMNHFELQPFNWPKACWGGDLQELLAKMPAEQRKGLLADWGGTTTADRRDWQRIGADGLRDGWYRIVFGEVERVEKIPGGRLTTVIREKGQAGGTVRYEADFVIDATGLEARAQSNPLLKDLIEHYTLTLNVLQRVHVEPDFEIPGLRNGDGRAYAAGAMTLGGPFAPVDSFLGLQYAAQRSLDALTAARAPGLRALGPLRSLAQWTRWARGVAP